MSAVVARPCRRLSRKESRILVRRVRDLVADVKMPTKRLAEILGCSVRTARRILNSGDKIPLLRRAYAHKVSRLLGVSMESICTEREQPGGGEIKGWKTSDTLPQARYTAAMLGLSVCNIATMAFGLAASFSVMYALDGRPASVEVTVIPGPAKRCVMCWYFSDSMGCVVMRYTNSSGAVVYDAVPTWSAIKTILSLIEHEQTHHTA